MSLLDEERKIYVVVEGIVCTECKGVLLDYGREDDPFYWCLNGNCNTFKVPKTVETKSHGDLK